MGHDRFRVLGLVAVCAVWVCAARGGWEITGLDREGTLTFCRGEPGSTCRVEWAAGPAGPWTNSWAGLEAVPAGLDGAITAAIPMCFRLAERAGPRAGMEPEDWGPYVLAPSCAANGMLTCTNLMGLSTCRVEWASSRTGPWHGAWKPLDAVTVQGDGSGRMELPRFYRVVGRYPVPDFGDMSTEYAAVPTNLDARMDVSNGWEGEYFVAPNTLLTPVSLEPNGEGSFTVGEMGGFRISRVTREGRVTDYYDSAGVVVWAVELDTNDNAYLWGCDHGRHVGSIERVDAAGHSMMLASNEATLYSQQDSGVYEVAPDGTVYLQTVNDDTNRMFVRVDPDGHVEVIADPHEVDIWEMEFDGKGALAIVSGGLVRWLDTATGAPTGTVFDFDARPDLGLGPITTLRFDPIGRLWVSDRTRIAMLDERTNAWLVATGFPWLQSLAADADGTVYAVMRQGGGMYRVREGRVEAVIAPGKLTTPEYIGVNSFGEVYVYQRESLAVAWLSADADVMGFFDDCNIFPPYGNLEVDEDDTVFVTSARWPNGDHLPMELWEWNRDGSASAVVVSNINRGSGMAVLSNVLYVADTGSNVIYRVDGAEMATVWLPFAAVGLTNTLILDFDSTGLLYAASGRYIQDLVRVGPGTSTVLWYQLTEPGETFSNVRVGPGGRVFGIVHTGWNFAALYEFPAQGVRQLVASGFVQATGLGIDASGRVYVSDMNRGCVIRFREK